MGSRGLTRRPSVLGFLPRSVRGAQRALAPTIIADRLGREEYPTHDHLCPDDLRRELLAALDSLPEDSAGG